jgi:MFS family permease
VVTLFSMFMISLCREYYQFFLAQGFLLGVGQAFLACPVLAMISRHFNKHRGLATGFTIAGSSLGGVIWPIMVNELLNKDGVSFGWTIRIVAFTMLPLVVITCATVHPPAPEKPKEEEAATSGTTDKQQKRKKTDLSIVKNRVFQTFCAGIGLFYLGMFSPFFFTTSYAVSIGFSTSFGFYLVSILNAASLFGRISAGWLADRYGHFNLCSISAVLSAAVAFCWTAATSSAGIVVWALAYGFCSGVSWFLNAWSRFLANFVKFSVDLGSTSFLWDEVSDARDVRYRRRHDHGNCVLDVSFTLVVQQCLSRCIPNLS